MGEQLNLILLLALSSCVHAQSPARGDVPVPPDGIIPAEPASCSGSVAGAVIITIVVMLLLAAVSYSVYRHRRKPAAAKKITDPEFGISGGYDNPQFIGDDGCDNEKLKNVGPPSIKTACETNPSANKSTATNTSGTLDRGISAIEKVLSAMAGGVKIGTSLKVKDDSCLETRQILVPLQGRDFTGLGFNILGNMKEGIFVKDVHLRGPASETGKVAVGDQIMAVTVLTDHMVFEDAHTILSYASPYPVILHLKQGKQLASPSLFKGKLSPSSSKLKGGSSKGSSSTHTARIAHPKLSRAQSFDKLTNVGVQVRNATSPNETSPRATKGSAFPFASVAKEAESYVKRDCANRYSERAIDVPGADTNVKKDDDEKDSFALTSVQVHRTTLSVEEETCTGEALSKVNQKQEACGKNLKEDSKPKFGIKVLPEIISFKEKNINDSKPKKSSDGPFSTKSKAKSGIDTTDDSVSSISITSSKKKDANMKASIPILEPCSGEKPFDQIDKPSVRNHVVSNDNVSGPEININHQNDVNSDSISPSSHNLTFFSHANFPQISTSSITPLALGENINGNIDNEDVYQQSEPIDVQVNQDVATFPEKSQLVEVITSPTYSPWLNEEAPSGESTPDHELDDSALSEINATDATKKRKYRYMLATSSIVLPDGHQIEDANLSVMSAQELWENQSDEAKSLSLIGKPPNLGTESSVHNGNTDVDEVSFYSANMSATNMALDLDDIEIEQVGNVSDEMKFFVSNVIPTSTEINNVVDESHSESDETPDSNGIPESSANCQSKNNTRKISFTEFALSDTIPLDMTTLSFNANNEDDQNVPSQMPEVNREAFGSIFGFQGFKNRSTSVDTEEDAIHYNLDAIEIADIHDIDKDRNINEVPGNSDASHNIAPSIFLDAKIESDADDAELSKTEDVIAPSLNINTESIGSIETTINEESKKAKPKMNFVFRGLSRSSSDTDEDKQKVSSDPTGKPEKKSKIKSSLPFKFRSRSRSSDSEDSTDNRKVKTDPSGIEASSNLSKRKPDDSKQKYSKDGREYSTDSNKLEDTVKAQKPPRIGLKKSSDSDEDLNDSKVTCNPKGLIEKLKDPKAKSLKLGFKGFKNLKGKIQTEINKIRQETTPSDEDCNYVESKEIKDNNQTEKYEEAVSDQNIDTLMMEHAASAAKENRRKVSRKSSSSTISSEEEGYNLNEQRKKKKTKSKKRIDKSRIVTTGAMQVDIPSTETNAEINEVISAEFRSFPVDIPAINEAEGYMEVVPLGSATNIVNGRRNSQILRQNLEKEDTTIQKYVVMTEMKLSPTNSYPNSCSIDEVIEKVNMERKIPRPMLIEERLSINVGTDTDGGSYGSDSDMDHLAKGDTSQSETSVNLTVSGKRTLTDSEELKRKTASLGDLSRINDRLDAGSVLERAVSLDLNATTDNHGGLHVKRLKLPDSSATSIDEVDEKVSYSPIKLEQSIMRLKSASQWGTLEEALKLRNKNSFSLHNSNQSDNEMNGGCIIPNDIDESISNIEISGGCGPSITSLSSNEDLWNSVSYDTHPLAEIIPNSKGKTTITLQNNAPHNQDNHYKSDSSIVIIPGSSADRNELSNINVKVPPLSVSTPDVLLVSNNFNSDDGYNHDFYGDPYPANLQELGSNKVTLTMISAENNDDPPHMQLKPIPNQTSISPDLHSFDSGISAPVVTVSNDWSQCDRDVNIESSDLNSSDEFLPGASPQKSMTQISLDDIGVSGYMVQDGDFSKTVIISNPDLIS